MLKSDPTELAAAAEAFRAEVLLARAAAMDRVVASCQAMFKHVSAIIDAKQSLDFWEALRSRPATTEEALRAAQEDAAYPPA